MANLGTWLYTKLHGEFIGDDEYGNRYFRSKDKKQAEGVGRRNTERRWVIYNGRPEPSKVPPYWHGWLHHTTDKIPTENDKKKPYKWVKDYLPNLTGTNLAYQPPGHVQEGGKRDKATGDYEPWKPE